MRKTITTVLMKNFITRNQLITSISIRIMKTESRKYDPNFD